MCKLWVSREAALTIAGALRQRASFGQATPDVARDLAEVAAQIMKAVADGGAGDRVAIMVGCES